MGLQRDAATRFLINVANLEILAADPVEIKDGDVWRVNTDDTHGKVKFAIASHIITIDQAGAVAVQS